jgi:predicted enzyme related to lactoylglutathione lyase
VAISIYGTSFDATDAAAIAAFWAEALGRSVQDGATTERASLALRDGTTDTPILFHGVPEAKTVKNRLHLDLVTSDYDTELSRLQGLGATVLAEFPKWTTLADPEGNEFDLIRG